MPGENVIVLDTVNFNNGNATGELFIPGERYSYSIIVFEGHTYVELHK
jgi:hypothetical protein